MTSRVSDINSTTSTHPLASELSSLRLAVSRFQDEAYTSSVKLQRHSLDAANAHDRLVYLERENEVLRTEITILRANPHPDALPQSHPAVSQAQQLSLSLRRLSDKLSLTEAALLEKTTELSHATAEIGKAKLTADAAYELAARTRGREEMGKLRELELEQKVKAAEEAAKMSDLVVNEYADLVRSLKAGDSHEKLVDGLAEGKVGLQRLLNESSVEIARLQGDLLKAQGLITSTKSKSVAQKNHVKQCRIELAQAQFELQQLKTDDNAAAKMVSRYMKFSQKSTDTLSTALTALKTRHEATTTTLSSQLYSLRSQLNASEAQTEVLRRALDELGGELAKEAFGRRREVALRIRMVNREEKLKGDLERWLLKANEGLARQEGYEDIARKMIDAARAVLEGTLGGEEGSSGRVVVAEAAVRELTVELEEEMRRRLELERLLAVENASVSVPVGTEIDQGRREAVNGTAAPIPDDVPVTPSTVTAGLPGLVPTIIVDPVHEDEVHDDESLPEAPQADVPPIAFRSQDTIPTPIITPDHLATEIQPSAPEVVEPTPIPVADGPSEDVDGTKPLSTDTNFVHDSPIPPEIPPQTTENLATPASFLEETSSGAINEDNKDEALLNGSTAPHALDSLNETEGDSPVKAASGLPESTDGLEPSSEATHTESLSGFTPVMVSPNGHAHVDTVEVAKSEAVVSDVEMSAVDGDVSQPSHSATEELLDTVISNDGGISLLVEEPPFVAYTNGHAHINTTNATKHEAPVADVETSASGVDGDLSQSSLSPQEQLSDAEVAEEGDISPQVGEPPEEEIRNGFADVDSRDHTNLDSTHESELEISPLQAPPSPPAQEKTFSDLDLDLDNAPPPLLSLSSNIPKVLSMPKPPPPPTHPLLAELAKAKHRYDALQRSLRDCHLALETLSTSLTSSPSIVTGHVPVDALRTAVQRLTDYTEDARVELEIQIADEELVAIGFETLLQVPGALVSPSPTPSFSHSHASSEDHDQMTHSDVEAQIHSFVAGSDANVDRALKSLTRKVDDVEHDIAVLKRAMYDSDREEEDGESSAQLPVSSAASTGGGWSSWIRSPVTPEPPVNPPMSAPGPRPTFGSVITTPRLRHSPSLGLLGHANGNGNGIGKRGVQDPLANLGLKVPMPSYIQPSMTSAKPPLMSPSRLRTVSTMYMLGLGARSVSGPGTPGLLLSSPRKEVVGARIDHREDDDSDIE